MSTPWISVLHIWDFADQVTLIPKIQSALEYLKRVPFYFDTVEINSADNYSVNTGAYFLDSEVGKMTALEDYLEQRRAMEIKEIEPSFEANEQ